MKKNNLPRGLRNNNPGNIRINDDLFQGEIRPSPRADAHRSASETSCICRLSHRCLHRAQILQKPRRTAHAERPRLWSERQKSSPGGAAFSS